MSLDEIWMSGDFTAESALKLRKDILEHAALGEDVPILIYINSYGGSVDALNKILDTIESLPNKVVTICSGTAMSAGAFLLCAGDERYIGKNSRVMIHQASAGVFGTVNEMDANLKEFKKMNNRIINLVSKRCGKSVKDIKELFGVSTDKYFSPQEARKFGLVDKIGTPRLKTVTTYEIA